MLEGDSARFQGEELWEADTDISNVFCVSLADLSEERGYVLGGAHGEIEAIPAVEERAGFAVDSFAHLEELRCEVLSLIVTYPRAPRANTLLLQ